MSSIQKLTSFYDSLLAAVGCTIDENTREVFLSYNGEDTPVYVNKKRLISINNKIVRNGLESNQVAFHPLSESVTAGMSEVHQWLLQAINVKLNTYVSMAAIRIASIASIPKLQSQLKPKEISIFKNLTEVDEKLVESVETIANLVDITDKTKVLVHVRCKKSGTLGGKTYGRVTYVTFPIIDELDNALASGTVFGKSIRKKDIRAMQTIFREIILNNRTDVLDFSSGNTTTNAPYLSSMLCSFYNVLTRLNSLQRAIGDLMKITGLRCDISWYPESSSFSELQKAVPQLDGNVGTIAGAQDKPKTTITKQISHRETDFDGDEVNQSVSGINTAIEINKEPKMVERGGMFKAVPIKDGMGARVESIYPVPNNPLGMATQQVPVNVNELTVDQYLAMKNQTSYGYPSTPGYGYQQPQTLRGRDAYSQRKQMGVMGTGYNHNPYPVVGNPMPVDSVPQLVNINGQLMQVVPVANVVQNQAYTQPTNQNQFGYPNSDPSDFSSFAR